VLAAAFYSLLATNIMSKQPNFLDCEITGTIPNNSDDGATIKIPTHSGTRGPTHF
jgi:hypothetical protein